MTVRRLMPEELTRIKRKLAATSPGPWSYDRFIGAGEVPSKNDLGFICDAPEIVARLLDEIEALEVEIEQLKLTLSARIKHE